MDYMVEPQRDPTGATLGHFDIAAGNAIDVLADGRLRIGDKTYRIKVSNADHEEINFDDHNTRVQLANMVGALLQSCEFRVETHTNTKIITSGENAHIEGLATDTGLPDIKPLRTKEAKARARDIEAIAFGALGKQPNRAEPDTPDAGAVVRETLATLGAPRAAEITLVDDTAPPPTTVATTLPTITAAAPAAAPAINHPTTSPSASPRSVFAAQNRGLSESALALVSHFTLHPQLSGLEGEAPERVGGIVSKSTTIPLPNRLRLQLGLDQGEYTIKATKSLDPNHVVTWDFKVLADGEAEPVKWFEVNQLKQHTYNGPKQNDFYRRLDLMVSTARAAGADEEQIAAIQKECLEKLEQHPLKTADRNFSEAAFDQVFNKASKALKRAARSLNRLEHVDGNLEELEREAIHRRGRPVIVNTLTVSKSADEDTTTFVSIHNPQGDETTPSSIRTGPGLANYVSTSFGVLQSDGTVDIRSTGIRHSVLAPVGIKDNNTLRQAFAMKNAQTSITDLAMLTVNASGIPEGNSRDKPLVIHLDPTTLLSPKKWDQIRNKRAEIIGSEQMQLRETMRAYRLINEQPIEMRVGEETVWVKPQICHTNFGVNQEWVGLGMGGKTSRNAYFTDLNTIGVMQKAVDVEAQYDSLFSAIPDRYSGVLQKLRATVLDGDSLPYLSPTPSEQALLHSLARDYETTVRYAALPDDSTLSPREQTAKYKRIAAEWKAERVDAEAIDQLRTDLERLGVNADDGEALGRAIVKDHRAREKSTIPRNERTSDAQFASRCERMQQGYDDAKARFLDNKAEILGEVMALEGLTKVERGQGHHAAADALAAVHALAEAHYNALNAVFTDTNDSADTIMEAPAAMIKLSDVMQAIPTFFCKSAEDRTGNTEFKMAAREMFMELEGRDPGVVSNTGTGRDDKAMHEFERMAMFSSASLSNTQYNSDARGYQIGGAVNNLEISPLCNCFNKMAKLAKHVYK